LNKAPPNVTGELENRLTIPTLFADTGGAWCVLNKLACWRAVCGKLKKNIFSGKMGPFPPNYITANGLTQLDKELI
jgi:hypothetical protein